MNCGRVSQGLDTYSRLDQINNLMRGKSEAAARYEIQHANAAQKARSELLFFLRYSVCERWNVFFLVAQAQRKFNNLRKK